MIGLSSTGLLQWFVKATGKEGGGSVVVVVGGGGGVENRCKGS